MSVSADTLPLAVGSEVRSRGRSFLLAGVLLLVFSVAMATALGAVSIPLETSVRLVGKGILQMPMASEERAQAAIVYLIRFPPGSGRSPCGRSASCIRCFDAGALSQPFGRGGYYWRF